MLKCWGLSVPEFASARVDTDVVDAYVAEKGKLSDRYTESTIKVPFFASRKIGLSNNLEEYNSKQNFSKKHFDLFRAPLDIIKIGLFDLWVGNKDRKPENPNILISGNDRELEFCPIDHTAAFAHCDRYININDLFLFLENRFRILTIPLIKSIANFGLIDDNRANFEQEVVDGMKLAANSLQDIFTQIPLEWGLNKKDKAKIIEVLSDNERINRIAKIYLEYIR